MGGAPSSTRLLQVGLKYGRLRRVHRGGRQQCQRRDRSRTTRSSTRLAPSFCDDLNCHVRLFGGGLLKGLTDYSFELDDDGVPYWVLTTYKNRWLFSLPEADGVLTVNDHRRDHPLYHRPHCRIGWTAYSLRIL